MNGLENQIATTGAEQWTSTLDAVKYIMKNYGQCYSNLKIYQDGTILIDTTAKKSEVAIPWLYFKVSSDGLVFHQESQKKGREHSFRPISQDGIENILRQLFPVPVASAITTTTPTGAEQWASTLDIVEYIIKNYSRYYAFFRIYKNQTFLETSA